MNPPPTWYHRLESISRLLREVAGDLGVAVSHLHQAEEVQPGKMTLERACDTLKLAGAGSELADRIAKLKALCGEALSLALKEGDLPVADAADDDLGSVIDEVSQAARTDPDYEVTLRLSIDKRKLFADLSASVDSVHFEPYFFPQTLVRIFGRSLAELESQKGLFGETYKLREKGVEDGLRKLILLVPGADLSIDGERFAVIGGRYLADCRPYVPERCPVRKPAEDMRELAVTRLNWIDLSLRRLTPLDLLAKSELPPGKDAGKDVDGPAPKVMRAFYSRLLDACLLYTADRTRRSPRAAPDDWTSTFSGGGHQVEIRWGTGTSQASRSRDAAFFAGVEHFAQVVRRAYAAGNLAAERLHNLQGVLARMLTGTPAEDGYSEVARLAEKIDDNEDWSWQSLRDGKLSRYFDHMRELTVLLDATVERYRTQFQALIKGVLDNTLAAAAVVIAFFIGSLFDPKLNPDIVLYGLLVYAGYMLLFPGILGLSSACSQFRQARQSYLNRELLFCQLVDERAVVSRLRKEARSAANRFWLWFGIIAVVYAVIVLLLCLAAYRLPELLGSPAGRPGG